MRAVSYPVKTGRGEEIAPTEVAPRAPLQEPLDSAMPGHGERSRFRGPAAGPGGLGGPDWVSGAGCRGPRGSGEGA